MKQIDLTKLTPNASSKNQLLTAKANILEILKQNGITAGATTNRFAGGVSIHVYSKNIRENEKFELLVELENFIKPRREFYMDDSVSVHPTDFQRLYLSTHAFISFYVRVGDREFSTYNCHGDLEKTLIEYGVTYHELMEGVR